MWKQKLINALYAVLCMAIITFSVVLFMLQAAEPQHAIRNWSTLDAVSIATGAAPHPQPPGAVVVNNGQLDHTSLTRAAETRP